MLKKAQHSSRCSTGPWGGLCLPPPVPGTSGPVCCITVALQKPEPPAVTAAPYLRRVTRPQKQALLFRLPANQPLKNRRWLREGAWGESVLEGAHPWGGEDKTRASLPQPSTAPAPAQSFGRSTAPQQRCFAACTSCLPPLGPCSRGWDPSAPSGRIQAPSSLSWREKYGWRWRGLGSS